MVDLDSILNNEVVPRVLVEPQYQLWLNQFAPNSIPLIATDPRISARLHDDAAFMARLFFRFNPHPYQLEIIESKAKYQTVRMARQTGKTFSLAFVALRDILTHEKYTEIVIAPSLRQARVFRDRVDAHLGYMPKPLIKQLFSKVLRESLHTRAKSTLRLFPNSPDMIRGETAHKVMGDEVAMMKNDQYLFRSVLWPMLQSTGGGMTVSSTPKVIGSEFHRMCEDPNFAHFHFTWREGENAGQIVPADLAMARERLKNDPHTWQMEYEAEFVEQASVFMPYSLIRECVDPILENMSDPTITKLDEKYGPGSYFVGVDFGKSQDYTVVMILQEQPDRSLKLIYWRQFVLGTPYAVIKEYLDNLNNGLHSISRMYVDKTGVGEYLFEELSKSIRRVGGVMFSLQRKAALGNLMRNTFELKEISIPDDPELIDNLNVVNYEKLPSDIIKFMTPEDRHDDIFWSLALAIAAAKEPRGRAIEIV